jgi:amino acid permease
MRLIQILCLFWVAEAFLPPQQLQLHRSLSVPLALTSTPSLSSDENVPDEAQDAAISSANNKRLYSTSFSVMKAMLGTGLLSLPSGLAAISNDPSSLWAGCTFFSLIAALSAYTFALYGRLTHAYFPKANNLGDLWQAVYAEKKSTLIPFSNFIYCFGCALAYILVIGDSVTSLMGAWWSNRSAFILAVAGGILWPLCNLPSLASLAPLSLIGVTGTVVTTAFLAWRCPVLQPSSPYATAGLFHTYNRVASPAPLLLIAMSCVALMAHFSAPEFYHALTGGRTSNDAAIRDESVLKKFNIMTAFSYSAVTLISMAAMAFGFLTFGANAQGIILNNYPAQDWGAKVSKSLIVTSVVGGFPFVFDACRSAALQLWGKGREGEKKQVTALLLSILTGIALFVKDAGFVISFNGALTGTAIIYTYPALLYLKHTSKDVTRRMKNKLERYFCKFLVGFGFACSILGAITAVLHSYFPHVLGV